MPTETQLYTILDCTTGQRVSQHFSKSKRGAMLRFRRDYHTQHNHPNAIAMLSSELTQTPKLTDRLRMAVTAGDIIPTGNRNA